MSDPVNLDFLRGLALGAAGQRYAPVTPLQLLDLLNYALRSDRNVEIAVAQRRGFEALRADAEREMRKFRDQAVSMSNSVQVVVQLEDAIRAALAAPDLSAARAILQAALKAPYPEAP